MDKMVLLLLPPELCLLKNWYLTMMRMLVRVMMEENREMKDQQLLLLQMREDRM